MIKANLTKIRTKITTLEKDYNRKPNSVKLLAVSKNRSILEITQAIAAGQKAFGESYVAEAVPKIKALSNQNIEWHFIGPIQSNKTRAIADNFSWVHSIDRYKVARRLNDSRSTKLPHLNVCLEINISGEPSKAGVSIEELPELAAAVVKLPQLRLRGLMTIPAATSDFKQQRTSFRKTKEAFDLLKHHHPLLDTLSMGMSNDFETAIAEGATIIRMSYQNDNVHLRTK